MLPGVSVAGAAQQHVRPIKRKSPVTPTQAADQRRYRKYNVWISLASASAVLLVYLITTRNRPMSDNVGMVLVPLVALLIYLPGASFVSGFLQTLLATRGDTVFIRARFFLKTQPVGVWFLGFFGALFLLSSFLGNGWKGLTNTVLFPFWAL